MHTSGEVERKGQYIRMQMTDYMRTLGPMQDALEKIIKQVFMHACTHAFVCASTCVYIYEHALIHLSIALASPHAHILNVGCLA